MRSALAVCATCVVLVSIGCNGYEDLLGPTGVLPGTTGNLPGYSAREAEPNDDFARANSAVMQADSALDLEGSVSSILDIDIYDLGPVAVGDRITAAVDCSRSLDLAAAVFDDQQRLISTNDDRWWQTDLRPSLAVTMRHESQHCYLVVAASPLADVFSGGGYTVSVLRETSSVPEPRAQAIYLNFNGGHSILLPEGTVADIPAFDAANIDPSYAGQTAAMAAAIARHVRIDYARFNVQIITSMETSIVPPNATILHFGLYSDSLLGIADSVDEYNTDLTQTAIIFTDTFSLFMPLNPSLEEMALAIANVASHESGHLLGLEHTQDWSDLMDTTAPAQALLDDQDFRLAPLYDQVFPIGMQDGALLLAESLGVSPNAAAYDIDNGPDFANTVDYADNRPSANTGVEPSSSRSGGPAGVSPAVWRLLLYGHRSGQGYVSKDLFAVHSRRSVSR